MPIANLMSDLVDDLYFLNDRRYPAPKGFAAPSFIEGLPTQAELDACPRLFTWGEIKKIIRDGNAEGLTRNKGVEARYEKWMEGTKEQHGSAVGYLREARLPWAEANQGGRKDERKGKNGKDKHKDSSNDDKEDKKKYGGDAANDNTDDKDKSEAQKSMAYTALEDVLPRLERANGRSPADYPDHPDNDVFVKYDPEHGLDHEQFAIILNDWPYCMPYGVRHTCIWCKIPIAHPSLVDYDADAWATIEQNGLCGFTGVTPFIPQLVDEDEENKVGDKGKDAPSLPVPQEKNLLAPTPLSNAATPTTPVQRLDAESISRPRSRADGEDDSGYYAIDVQYGGEDIRAWAGVEFESIGGHEVGNMVCGLWDPRGWETVWFVNPPRLQSIPDYAHFHVLVRRKTPEEIDLSEKIYEQQKKEKEGRKDRSGGKRSDREVDRVQAEAEANGPVGPDVKRPRRE